MELDSFKSKITDKNKTIFGLIGAIASLIFFGIENYVIFVIIIPCLMLMIPKASSKNNKTVGKFLMIILTIALVKNLISLIIDISGAGFSFTYGDNYIIGLLLTYIIPLILRIYAIFCSFLLTIPTEIT